jgi:hypothetical protein
MGTVLLMTQLSSMGAMMLRLGDHIALTAAGNPTPARAGFFLAHPFRGVVCP